MPERRHRKRGCVFAPITEQSMITFVPSCAVILVGPVMVTARTIVACKKHGKNVCITVKNELVEIASLRHLSFICTL